MLEELIENFQPGSMTTPELRAYLVAESDLTTRERRLFEGKLRQLCIGLQVFRRAKAGRNGAFSKRVPEEWEWRKLVLMSEKEKAKWYLEKCPEVGTPEYNLFKRLVKGFGVGGNEFYFWLRKLGS